MINKATDSACKWIAAKKRKKYIIRSNFSSIKKVSAHNMIKGYGKALFAEVNIPREKLESFGTTPEAIYKHYMSSLLAGTYAGMVGANCHVANGITAVYIACGQDVADISTSHVGTTGCEINEKGGLYVSLYIPNLLVGTVGGGVSLGTQRECLEIIGCYGANKVNKFAEIVVSLALAGEVAVALALATGTYVEAHEKYGRNRPKTGN